MAPRRNPTRLRAAVGHAVQLGLRRAGYELQAHGQLDADDERRIRMLRSQGITLLLDVGANEGQYARRQRLIGYEGRIVSFEPLSEVHARLASAATADEGWETRRLALGQADGDAEINVAGNSYSSSLLPMGERHLASAPESAYVGTETVPTARLDTIWDDVVRPDDRVWLKLDVQGYEMHVLRGAGERLADVSCIQAEMELVPLYKGDTDWRSFVDWLAERGFRLAGLEAGFGDQETGEMLQADGIFVRDER